MLTNPQETADLVKFTDEILNGKLHLLCSVKTIIKYRFQLSIIAIKENCNSDLSFSFYQVERDEIMKKLITLRQIKPHKAQTCP